MTWIPVQAQVLDVRTERHRRGSRDSRRTVWLEVVEYRYRTPDTGQDVTATDWLPDDEVAVPGQTITVYLDSDDSTVSRVQRPSRGAHVRGCGCAVLVLLGPLLIGAGLLALWIFTDVNPILVFSLTLGATLFLAGAAALLALSRMLKRLPTDWPQAPAIVTKAAREADPDRPGRTQRWLTIHYTYRDHLGFEREGSGLFTHPQSSIKRGDEVTVRVDPTDGSRSFLQPASPRQLKFEMGLVIFLMIVAVIIAMQANP